MEEPSLDRRLAQLGNWIIAWVLIPNTLFLAVSIAAGGPPLYPQILLTGLIGLIARRAPYWLQLSGLTAAVAWSSLCFIAGIFRLSVWSALQWAPYLLNVEPFAAPEYIALAVGLLGTLVAAAFALQRDTSFNCGRCAAVATVSLLSLAAADAALAEATETSYDRLARAGTPFTSGVKQSHFLDRADGKHHLVKIMVESMGLPTDPQLHEKLLSRWQQPDIQKLYEVQIGTTPFYGATTHGEIRGLCGRWSDYSPFLRGYHSECLPAQLRQKGYGTTAIHSFTGNFFERRRWYRNVGFSKEVFRDDLLRAGVPECGGVFPAACDRAVPEVIKQRLASAEEPEFIYWLTVNSHLPIVADASLQTKACQGFSDVFAEEFTMTCRLFQVWEDLNDSVARMALDPTLPPTNILISGDHAPPFVSRAERALFDSQRVPWILLKRRDLPAVPGARQN